MPPKHKKAFDYDEDTKSLTDEPTLTTVEIPFSNGLELPAGNASITSEAHCYEIEVDEPQFNYHGLKAIIPKQESPITICTADTIGTVRSQSLF